METRYPDAPRQDVINAGDEFEDFVCDALAEKEGIVLRTYKSKAAQFTGENKAGWEIKLDATHTKWGHLSIEIAERTKKSGPWYSSGIYRNDNTWLYIQGNREVFWIFHKPTLVEYAENERDVTKEYATSSSSMWPFEETATGGIMLHDDMHESFGTIRKFYLEYEDADLLGKRIDLR